MLVDTGAARTCVSTQFYRKHKQQLGPLRKPNISLVGAGDTPLNVLGITKPIPVIISNKSKPEATLEVIVVDFPQQQYDGYLGFDMLAKSGSIIDCEKSTITTQKTPGLTRQPQAHPPPSVVHVIEHTPPLLHYPTVPDHIQQAQPAVRHQQKKRRKPSKAGINTM